MNSNPIVDTFLKFFTLSEQAKLDLDSIIYFKEIPKGTHLLSFGEIASTLYLIKKGLARAYYIGEDGRDVSFSFAIDNQYIGSVPSIISGKPSTNAIELLENSDVYSFSYKDFDNCCFKHHDLAIAAYKLTSAVLLRDQVRAEGMHLHSAKERYEMMETIYPGITNRCQLKHIASYIGTSQVSLSRIRAGIQ